MSGLYLKVSEISIFGGFACGVSNCLVLKVPSGYSNVQPELRNSDLWFPLFFQIEPRGPEGDSEGRRAARQSGQTADLASWLLVWDSFSTPFTLVTGTLMPERWTPQSPLSQFPTHLQQLMFPKRALSTWEPKLTHILPVCTWAGLHTAK